MLEGTLFRSDEVPAEDRFERWRDLVRHTHAPIDLRSAHHRDFRAVQRLIPLGPVTIWPTVFQPVTFHRTPRLIRQSDPEGIHLSLPFTGPLFVTHGANGGDGRAVAPGGGRGAGRREEYEVEYRPYSLSLVDSSRPVLVRSQAASHEGVGLEIPKSQLPFPRDVVDGLIRSIPSGPPLSGREGYGRLLTQLLSQLAKDSGEYGPADAPRLGLLIVSLVSSLFARTLEAEDALPPETAHRALLLRIREYIGHRLADRDLGPTTIAARHHLSVRSLQVLFQREGETVTGHIRARRLAGARAELADATLRRPRAVHEIAARWGFSTHADFSRAFRRAYGMSPTEYRAATRD